MVGGRCHKDTTTQGTGEKRGGKSFGVKAVCCGQDGRVSKGPKCGALCASIAPFRWRAPQRGAPPPRRPSMWQGSAARRASPRGLPQPPSIRGHRLVREGERGALIRAVQRVSRLELSSSMCRGEEEGYGAAVPLPRPPPPQRLSASCGSDCGRCEKGVLMRPPQPPQAPPLMCERLTRLPAQPRQAHTHRHTHARRQTRKLARWSGRWE